MPNEISASKIFFYLCLSLIAGIALRQITYIYLPVIPVFFILGIILISLFWADKKAVLLGFCIIFVSLGICRSEAAISKIENSDFLKYQLFDKSIDLTAVVESEPQKNEKYLRFIASDILIDGGIPIKGKIMVITGRYPEFNFNDKLKISGKLEAPEDLDGFDYRKYLEKDGIFAMSNFSKIELVGRRQKAFYAFEAILFLKTKLREGIERNFSPPHSLILEGMILGDNNALGNDLKNKLNITGLRHIIAISGTHIVILSAILMSFFISIGLWRGQAFYLSLFFIIIYIILSGSPSSGIRAGIMGVIFMYGQKIGRKSIGARTIVIACSLMLLINPLILFYDVGFQLSFLACLGMIYFSPILLRFFSIVFKGKLNNLSAMVSATLSAQLFTLPIIIYNFGSISAVSILTNILILPAVYLIMVFGFLSSFFGAVFDLVSWIFILPTWLLLSYFIKIVDVFSIPRLSIQLENTHWSFLALSYSFLFLFIYYLNKKSPKGFL